MNFKKLSLLPILLAVLFLSVGCATQKTVDMADSYNDAYSYYVDAESDKVESKTSAIKDLYADLCKEDTAACGMAKAFGAALGSREIAEIKSDPFTLEKHATDIDAQIVIAKEVGKGLPIAGMTITSVKAIDKDKGSVVNRSDNGSTVNNSYDEDHATNLGDDSTAGNYPAQDNGTESVKAVE